MKNYNPEVVNNSKRPDEFSTESKDCTVRALTSATGLPYGEAHEMLRKFGRKKGKGVHFTNFIGNWRRINGRRITPSNMFNGLTLNKLYDEPTFMKGDWIIRVHRHVYYVNKGVIHDNHMCGGRTKVMWIFKIT